VEAAWNQGEFYTKVWEDDFEYWFAYFLQNPDDNDTMIDSTFEHIFLEVYNASLTSRDEAYGKALRKATGSSQCFLNRAGTSWFFFTIMTTIGTWHSSIFGVAFFNCFASLIIFIVRILSRVLSFVSLTPAGYGNQAPITMQGRVVMVTFGFVSILLFGGILASTGSVLAMMYDDTVKKFRWSFLARPLWSLTFWGIITALWTMFLGFSAHLWWGYRLKPDEVPSANDATWFAYLSTTSIGLGDYYFEPEVIFMRDAFLFAFIFLGAFTFFAAFLTRLSTYILGEFPDAGEILKIRLEGTSILGNRIGRHVRLVKIKLWKLFAV
jgi:hypothetical protein